MSGIGDTHLWASAEGSEVSQLNTASAEDARERKKCVLQCIGDRMYHSSPVWSHGRVVGVIQAVYDRSYHTKVVDASNGHLIEVLSTSCSCLLQHQEYRCALDRARLKADALLSVSKVFLSENTVGFCFQAVVDCFYAIFGPDLVTMYMIDHIEQEAWICISKDGLEGLTVKFGQGIAGTVAETGLTIVVDDAYADSRFIREVDERTGVVTRNMLCAGIPSFGKDRKPVAVLQIINKSVGKRFDDFDVSVVNEILADVSKLLRKKLYELHLFKMSSYMRNRPEKHEVVALEYDLLNTYGEVIRNPLEDFVNCSISFPLKHPIKDIGFSPGSFQKHEADLVSWDFVPFGRDPPFLINCLNLMFERFDIPLLFQVDKVMLNSFFGAVKELYRKDVAFHNFDHAWSVCHISSMILIDSELNSVLESKFTFSILLAALCHDLDHPGNSNSFEVAKRSELAIIYSDDAVLERHHCALTHRLIASPQYNLLKNVDPKDAIEVRRSVTLCIMGTEMSKHFEHLEQLQILAENLKELDLRGLDSAAQTHFCSHIVHCADLSGQVLNWDISLVWGERCVAEFRSQSATEVSLGLTLTPFMLGLESQKHAMLLQYGFVDTIVLPLWRALADCYPVFEERVSHGAANAEAYKIAAEAS